MHKILHNFKNESDKLLLGNKLHSFIGPFSVFLMDSEFVFTRNAIKSIKEYCLSLGFSIDDIIITGMTYIDINGTNSESFCELHIIENEGKITAVFMSAGAIYGAEK